MYNTAAAFEALKPFLFDSVEEIDALELGIHDLKQFSMDVSPKRSIDTVKQVFHQVPKGNLRTRVYSMADDMALYDSQEAYREAITSHPAYEAVSLELRSRAALGSLTEAMDILETMGVVVAYDKATHLLTLGFCLSKMRPGFQEIVPLHDRANARVIEWVNALPEVSLGGALYRKPKVKMDDEDGQPVDPTFFITFDLSHGEETIHG